MKAILKNIIIAVALVFAVVAVSAQVTSPPTSPPGPDCQDPNNPLSPPCPIPIDGGVVFLIAAGVAYGGKKAYELRNRE